MEPPPSGVVTFLFTDIEGSTGLWESDEPGMERALARHDAIMRAAIEDHGGYVFSTAGDSFAAAFKTPVPAVAAAVDAQKALGDVGLRVRMAIHTGEAHEREGDYFGPTVNRAARLMAAGHGSQLLVSSSVAELVGERVKLRDLGEHRLRDLTSTVHIWQLIEPGLDDDFPPLRTLDEARSNLPPQRTSLVGRDDDIQALVQALFEARLVTITGVGGMGKTRLAIHAAAEALPNFPGGVWLASLANVDAVDAVSDVVLTALGGRRQPGRTALASLRELTNGRRLLAVLDNCEHVLEAAAECAEAIVVDGESVVLATSREPLAVTGEHIFPVSSLPGDAALALFVERARAADPAFAVDERNRAGVSEICRRLDGMPLALELAASRVRSMSVDDLAHRLGARFRLLRGGAHGVVARHRTLQAAIEWSYDLLEPSEREMFDRLSVFAGGFTADAAAAICCDDNGDEVDVAIVLDALVARSMVDADPARTRTRYSLLETLRQFGEDRLLASGDTEERRARHARYFLELAEATRQRLSTPQAGEAMSVFVNEWDNLRVAFDWLASSGEVDGGLRLVVAASWFAELACQYELLPWAERALVLDGARDHSLWSAAAGATATIQAWTGDLVGAESLASEALHQEDRAGLSSHFEPVKALSFARLSQGKTDLFLEAIPTMERIAERGRDPLELAHARLVSRAIAYLVTDVAGAGTFADDAVREAEASGNPHQLAYAYLGQLVIAAGHRDVERARRAYARARRWSDVAGNRVVEMNAPVYLAMAAPDDQPLEALSLVREVLAAYDETGTWGNLDHALRRIVMPLVRLGHDRAAALLLGGMSGLTSSTPDTQQVVPRAMAALEQTLGDDLTQILDEGRGLTRQELVRLAIDEIDTCLNTGTR
jgi:predicted ATPase/class 3 adenylate cyclase